MNKQGSDGWSGWSNSKTEKPDHPSGSNLPNLVRPREIETGEDCSRALPEHLKTHITGCEVRQILLKEFRGIAFRSRIELW